MSIIDIIDYVYKDVTHLVYPVSKILVLRQMLVPLLWYLETNYILNMGSFILRGEVWIRIQFQAPLLMIHISQDSFSCIDGKHDNESLSENAVALFIKTL